MAFKELGILVILDPKREERNSPEYEQRPRASGNPGSSSRGPATDLRRGCALIVAGRFIHVCGHRQSQLRLFRRGHGALKNQNR